MREVIQVFMVCLLALGVVLGAYFARMAIKVERELREMHRKARAAAERYDSEGRLVSAEARREIFALAFGGDHAAQGDDDFLRSIGIGSGK